MKLVVPLGRTAVIPWALTEENIRAALIECRGDIFVASQMLGVTALRLDRAMRCSDLLQATFSEIQKTKADPAFDSLAAEAFEREIQRRVSMYRVAGLDALHDLATMQISENSAQNQVKLAAAARLAGPTEGSTGGGEMAETLRSLNDLYHQQAPRIRVVRERLTVELSPGTPAEHPPLESDG